MKKIIVFVFLATISIIQACQTGDDVPALQNVELVKRGEYLVNIIGCNDCHTPKVFTGQGPVPDETRLLSGHPADMPLASYQQEMLKDWALFNHHFTVAAGPWGISYAANLTSDDSGIGLWTEGQFFRAMREGKFKGLENGRPLLPPMPWENFTQMTDEDLRAIFAYLKSTKPIRNIVPPSVVPAAMSMK